MVYKRFATYIKEDLNAVALETQGTPASEEAKRLGLNYVGFGRYENPASGQVTHIVQNNRLVPFGSAVRTNSYANESGNDFGNFTKALLPNVTQDILELQDNYPPEIYTNEELDAIKQFTDANYYTVNAMLNSLPVGINTRMIQPMTPSDTTPQTIAALDSAIAKSKLKNDLVVYTYLSDDVDATPFKEGTQLLFKAFRSTTINFENILTQMNPSSGGGVVLQILLNAGTNGMYVDDFSSTPGMSEYILPRSTSVTILNGPKKLSGTYQTPENNLDIHFYNCEYS